MRVLIAVFFLAFCSQGATACDLQHPPSTAWHIERHGTIAWLVDPCGGPNFSLGVNVVDRDGNEASQRLKSWGFTALGGWSLPPSRLDLPQIPDLELGRNARFHWFDPFDPAVDSTVMATATRLVRPYKNSPYRIGYYTDNEVGWWNGALFTFYQHKPAGNFTKRRWVAFLKAFYKTSWTRFTDDFSPPSGVGNWNALLDSTGSTHLRTASNGIQAVRRWAGIVAERYYSLTEKALRAADPQALIFGDRLPIYYDPIALRAEVQHVDVVSTNYNVDSPEGWIAPYYWDGLHQLTDGKPLLVSEWFYAATENRSGNTNNGHLMTVATQAERAAGAAQATRNFAALPDLVGAHWFQYADNPKGGRADGEDYDFGLVDTGDRPYEALTQSLAQVNKAALGLHAAAMKLRRPAAINIPEADIDFSSGSLKSWPKPASLLPPLKAQPGEVAFGEAYLAWTETGLAVASIGQDYYDLALLAPYDNFPLSEAYRIEIGVDAGAGARSFTLFFIPPKAAVKGAAQMRAVLCRDHPARLQDCATVPGGKADYFGADQPRITTQAFLPWKALGVSQPPTSRRIRADIAITAWYGSRWISLSGMASATHVGPSAWPTITLGPPVQRGAPSAPAKTP